MIRSFSFRTAATLASLSFAALAAAPAAAHVTLEQREAKPGTSYKAVFKVPHGCGSSPTQAIRVEIPEGFVNVKPMPKPGWTLATKTAAYATSYSVYGHTLTEGVKEITWSEGNLPDAHYDEFVAAGFVGKNVKPGPLYFKVTQTCAEGERAWVEIPDGSAGQKLASPASVLTIVDAGASAGGHDHHHHHHHDGAAKEASGSATVGTLAIEGGWARATPEGAKVAAGYLTVRNTGAEADTLISISTPVAGKSEIHDMIMTDDGVMKMRALPEGIEIPAGGAVELKPGGKHLMFLDLKEPLVAGTQVSVTVTFKSGATSEVSFPVQPIGGASGKKDGGGSHDHDGHDHH